ncbi:MAG TPA: hypothetical protein VMM18_15985, partial [Gemmatimonadaceae bacterium]|nr:hypothetical protein [Gemmatimonadaceae bacterium]
MNRFATALFITTAPMLVSGCPRTESPPAEDVAVCLEGQPFVAEGTVPLESGATGDAERIRRIRWEAHDGCERLVIDLVAAGDAPATSAGPVSAEVLRDLGVVRISLVNVRYVDTGATEARPGSALARAV